MSIRLIAAVALAVAPAVALAAAPTLTVTETATFKAPPPTVWAVIHHFGDMSWVPPVKSTTATNGDTPGSVRTIDLGGPKLVETLESYDPDGMSYSYTINDTAANKAVLPVSNYHSTIKVTPTAAGGSSVTWEGSFQRADTSDHPQAGMDDAAAEKAVRGVYQAGLGGLKQKTGG